MPNTTNYNWATPADTDLVKDGAAAIRTLGSSADTTVKNLNPGTTAGDIDYYTSSTAKARVAIGTAGQVLRVNSGGTAPEWATTADQTPLTTKGDLFTFSTVDARLGVGANGTVLTADSAETTGLKWAAPAGANFEFSLINSGGTALSGSSTTVSSISGKNTLWIYIDGASASSSLDNAHRLTLNGTGAYHYQVLGFVNTSFASERGSGSFFIGVSPSDTGNVSTLMRIDNCNSTNPKFTSWLSVGNTSGTYSKMFNGMGRWTGNAAITSVTYAIDSGVWDAGTIYVYGA